MQLFFFLLLASIAVASALLVILQRNPIYSVLFLVLTILALAGEFLLLNAQFIAALQVIVYAGAVMVLFLFVVMMLNLSREPKGGLRYQKFFGFVLAILLLLQFGYFIFSGIESKDVAEVGIDVTTFGTAERVGALLFTNYLLPVELASVLLLIAMIGAVVLVKRAET